MVKTQRKGAERRNGNTLKKMKRIFHLIFFLSLTQYCSAQVKGVGYDNIPLDNEVVKKGMAICKIISSGNIDSIKTLYPSENKHWLKQNRGWIDSLNTSLPFLKTGVIVDTLLLEYSQFGTLQTTVTFEFDCSQIQEDLTYWLRIIEYKNEDGKTSSQFYVQRDYYNLKIKKGLIKLPSATDLIH